MGNGGKEHMAHCHDTAIYMSLPEWEATFLLFSTPTTSLPFSFPSFPQQLSIPFKVPRLSFLLPSSVLSSTFLRSFPHNSTFPSLQPPSPLHLSRRNGGDIVHCPSFVSSEQFGFSYVALLHLDGSSIFVCASRPSLCHAPLHHRNYREP